ncbi:hypothetical protein EV204_1085 [Tissierella praeacuta]|uniref:hypothetical protein n=1 Tax=Tissierella praeacuta TaxID=43131 RepID=UPI001047CFE9|nr:hypothetical protein [Tissierella praeacuta]TCU69648.1 hypothetical protein EV204_1085 [Tissierella praeacuta]
MRIEEYELYEKGDKVLIYNQEHKGTKGIVLEDQIDINLMVAVKLENKEIITVWSDCLELCEV